MRLVLAASPCHLPILCKIRNRCQGSPIASHARSQLYCHESRNHHRQLQTTAGHPIQLRQWPSQVASAEQLRRLYMSSDLFACSLFMLRLAVFRRTFFFGQQYGVVTPPLAVVHHRSCALAPSDASHTRLSNIFRCMMRRINFLPVTVSRFHVCTYTCVQRRHQSLPGQVIPLPRCTYSHSYCFLLLRVAIEAEPFLHKLSLQACP